MTTHIGASRYLDEIRTVMADGKQEPQKLPQNEVYERALTTST